METAPIPKSKKSKKQKSKRAQEKIAAREGVVPPRQRVGRFADADSKKKKKTPPGRPMVIESRLDEV